MGVLRLGIIIRSINFVGKVFWEKTGGKWTRSTAINNYILIRVFTWRWWISTGQPVNELAAVAVVIDVTTLKSSKSCFTQLNRILSGALWGFRLRWGLLGLPGIRCTDISDAADG